MALDLIFPASDPVAITATASPHRTHSARSTLNFNEPTTSEHVIEPEMLGVIKPTMSHAKWPAAATR